MSKNARGLEGLAGGSIVRDLLDALPQDVAPERRNGSPVLDAPWQVRALGLAVALHVEQRCDWSTFQSLLTSSLQRAPADSRGYYERWIASLEKLAMTSGLVSEEELEQRTVALLALPEGHDHDHRVHDEKK